MKIPTLWNKACAGPVSVKILEGEADHRDSVGRRSRREAGLFLAWVSRANGELLVLDLRPIKGS